MGEYDTWLGIFRYVHVASGIVWIGLLYYFNLVQVPAFAKMEPAARANAIIHLASRALFFFRYAALSTVVFGIAWIILKEIELEDQGVEGYFATDAGKSISIGGLLGIIMFLNVWGIIWPNQKKIIAATTAGPPAPADQPKWARMALLASRTNVMLSIPMLFFMIASDHLERVWS